MYHRHWTLYARNVSDGCSQLAHLALTYLESADTAVPQCAHMPGSELRAHRTAARDVLREARRQLVAKGH